MTMDMVFVFAVLTVTVILFASDRLRLDVIALLALLALLLSDVLTPAEALAGFSDPIVLIIAGLFIKTGGMRLIASGLTATLGALGPFALMAGLFVLTALFSQFISNTATTVLMAPIALQAATALSVSPYPLLMMVAIAASTAFATPIASPVNTLVLGPGDYRFTDFVRVGTPLLFLVLLASLLVVPVVFPLQ